MIKKDFPIFDNNPGLVYLDSAATAQKSRYMIDGLKQYLEHDYANIHRGQYELSYRSEELFWQARKMIAEWMEVDEAEVIFTANATDASNVLVQSLGVSGFFQQGERIFLSEAEHHANIIPWMMACERYGVSIEWIPVDQDGLIDVDRIAENYDKTVRIVSITAVSNITGTISQLEEIGAFLSDKEDTYFVVDASQAMPHLHVVPAKRSADFCRWTGHKLGALPGVGVLWGKNALLSLLKPALGGGGAIESVSPSGYTLLGSPDKFEPGTPNLTGVLSIKLALEYLRDWSITQGADGSVAGVYAMIEQQERALITYCLQQFSILKEYGVTLLGSQQPKNRIGLFSFLFPTHDTQKTTYGVGQWLGQKNICIRCGGQCAQPYHVSLGADGGSCRMSLWIYNDHADCEQFFKEIRTYIIQGD